MTERPYHTPAFQNAVEYTVTLTFVVAGGKRRGTAERRGERVAERLANAAARLADVVEVVASGGVSHDGTASWPRPIRFAAANTARGRPDASGRLDRYLDPERERALRALAADNAASKARDDADRRRRTALGCRNPYRSLFYGKRPCDGACQPEEHLTELRRTGRGDPSPWLVTPRCLCGQRVTMTGQRCLRHRDAQLVALDGDPPALRLLADHVAAT